MESWLMYKQNEFFVYILTHLLIDDVTGTHWKLVMEIG